MFSLKIQGKMWANCKKMGERGKEMLVNITKNQAENLGCSTKKYLEEKSRIGCDTTMAAPLWDKPRLLRARRPDSGFRCPVPAARIRAAIEQD